MSAPYHIVADVGGTNTRLGQVIDGQVRADTVRRYRNDDFHSFDAVLDEYGTHGASDLCVDIAGPVQNGQARLTNRDWAFSEPALKTRFGFQAVYLINDMQAQGYAAWAAGPRDRGLVYGTGAPDAGTRLVINIGTGFNASPVYTVNGRGFVPENEAGHAALPPVDPPPDFRDNNPTEFLSIEEILSGRGLRQWVTGLEPSLAPDEDIFGHVTTHPSGPVARAVQQYGGVLGAVAGDLALAHLPFGGIFLVGGVAQGIAPLLHQTNFAAAFCAKGRFGEFMDQFSLYTLTNPLAALDGAATYLQMVMRG